jgi:cysteine desulfurase family protein (TIGR01976 family)
MTIDLDWVRARFPGLEPGFFENAGGSVPASAVIDRATRYLANDMVQLGAAYPRSKRASERFEAGKPAAAALLGAPAENVVLGSSATMNLYVLSHAFAANVAPGDEVVVSEIDHESNRGAWTRLAEARGATVREWTIDRESHELTLEGLRAVLGERTKIVAFTQVSNVVGSIHDAKLFVDEIHRAGARAIVDGVAFAPHRRVDVRAIGADAYVVSLYKIAGPHLSAMYVGDSMLETLANQNHVFLRGSGTYELMPGNASHELVASLPGIVEYLEDFDRHHGGKGDLDGAFARIAAHEAALVEPLLAFLHSHPKVRLLGRSSAHPDRRVATVAFLVAGRSSQSIPVAIAADAAIRAGHFYAARAMNALGVEDAADGVVRASLFHYNTPAEVGRLVEALASVI